MKFLSSPRLFIFLSIFSFLFLQNAFAQNPANKNFYSFKGGDAPKIFAAAKTSAPEKPKNESAKKVVNVLDIERHVFDLINKKRIEAGLTALEWNDDLTRVARLHSENMAAFNFFSHAGQDGKMVNNRADAAGIKHWQAIGENIAYNRGFSDPTECAVAKWMLSPGHRDNILKANWKESGIGVAVTANGTFYFTQVFLKK